MTDCYGEPFDGHEEDAIHKQYDWSDTDPSMAVVKTVAVATNQEATTLRPLYEVIDPDALDALVGENGVRTATEASISFIYEQCKITVNSSGDIIVWTLDSEL